MLLAYRQRKNNLSFPFRSVPLERMYCVTEARPYYAAARLRRWSQILDAAAKLMEQQA